MNTPIVSTPSAPHPQAALLESDYVSGIIRFAWLDGDGQPVDSGNSLARFEPIGRRLTDEEIAAAITASTQPVV